MQIIKWLGVAAAIALIVACYLPWIIVESKDLVVSGVETTGTNFGKPGYFHMFFAGIYLLFVLINRVWSKRVNIFISAFNIAWALRNFAIISACSGGECPEKQAGLYVVLIGSLVMLAGVLFSGAKESAHKE
ncbi:MAG TPA: hypothetical protein VGE66_13360 [Chitinophagaceae bacterium]